MEGVFKANDDRWEKFSFQIDQYLDAGDSIVVIGAYIGQHRQSQKSLRAVAAHVYDLVDSKVCRFRMFADTRTICDSIPLGSSPLDFKESPMKSEAHTVRKVSVG